MAERGASRLIDEAASLQALLRFDIVTAPRSGRKTLVQLAKSSDLDVKRQATWGMSDKIAVDDRLFAFANVTVRWFVKLLLHATFRKKGGLKLLVKK